jgi:hypothetical protein
MDSSPGAKDDVIVTDMKITGEKIMRVVNICDQRDTQSGERQEQKWN